MKKVLLFIMLLFTLSINVNAEVTSYRSVSFAYRYYDETYNYWTDWSDWEPSNLLITINDVANKISIYTEPLQVYTIIEYVEPIYDDNGVQMKFRMRDQDGDYGALRLRVQNDGTAKFILILLI